MTNRGKMMVTKAQVVEVVMTSEVAEEATIVVAEAATTVVAEVAPTVVAEVATTEVVEAEVEEVVVGSVEMTARTRSLSPHQEERLTYLPTNSSLRLLPI